MHHVVEDLLSRYESGKVTRRQLVTALAALCTGTQASAAAAPFQGIGLNHIAVRVRDIPRTRRFYQDLLGLPLISESSSSCFLRTGDQFLTFFKNEQPGLDHYCLEIADFNADRVMDKLSKLELKPRRASGTDRIYFRDPDQLEVQFAARGHTANPG